MDQVRTVDQRGESDPTWIGAVRGGYGNPVKVLHTTTPLSDNVTEAFRKALTARGMLAASGAGVLDLNVTIVDFQSSQYHRRDAAFVAAASRDRR